MQQSVVSAVTWNSGSVYYLPRKDIGLLKLMKLAGRLTLFVAVWAAVLAPLIFLINKFLATTSNEQGLAIKLLAEVCLTGTILLASFLVTRYVDKRPFVTLGFDRQHLVRDTVVGIVVGFLMILLCLVILRLLHYVSFDYSARIDPMALLGYVLLIYLNSITQEVLVRGYPLQSIESQYGTVIAVLVSSLLFAAMHIGGVDLANGLIPLLNIFLAGILLGLAYTKTRRLWLAFAIHFAWNFAQGPLLGIPVSGQKLYEWQLVNLSGPELISGGNYGLEGGLVATLVTLLAIGALFLPPLNRVTSLKGAGGEATAEEDLSAPSGTLS